ncbi:MAG: VCBS repeat-containing protein [Verrucomicrobia bacterium]|nr:VCBS repeat-containing protein [Verrucomicrobiota bacterium]
MNRLFIPLIFISTAMAVSAKDYYLHSFKKTQLTDQFWGEGANFGDFNRDGKMDVVSGPFWYAGPDFKQRHEFYPATEKFTLKNPDGTEQEIPGFEGALGVNNTYSKNFLAFSYDFNNDGWTDILILGFPGEHSSWYENPQGKPGHWKRHVAIDVTDNESPTFGDLTGDGKPEIICSSKGVLGYATPDRNNPTAKWTWHPISPDNNYHKFTHGLGFGDVNGDGRADILERDGWWEQPASLEGDPLWKHHKYPFAPGMGGAQMYAYDVNGDGLTDVITSFAAHGYGLSWHEQLKEKNEGEISFREHIILDKQGKRNKYGVSFSQLHGVDLVDVDGDGLKDIITGKRFWAHGPKGDPEPNAAAVLYWFKLVRNPDKSVDFIPFQIDDDSGVGTQVVAADFNGDKLPDIVVGNKKGTFVHVHERKKVSKKVWEAAQPKPMAETAATK